MLCLLAFTVLCSTPSRANEPACATALGLENKQFGAMAGSKSDRRVNFRGMWGHVGLRSDTSVGEIRGSSLPGVGLLPANPGPSPYGNSCHLADVRHVL